MAVWRVTNAPWGGRWVAEGEGVWCSQGTSSVNSGVLSLAVDTCLLLFQIAWPQRGECEPAVAMPACRYQLSRGRPCGRWASCCTPCFGIISNSSVGLPTPAANNDEKDVKFIEVKKPTNELLSPAPKTERYCRDALCFTTLIDSNYQRYRVIVLFRNNFSFEIVLGLNRFCVRFFTVTTYRWCRHFQNCERAQWQHPQ